MSDLYADLLSAFGGAASDEDTRTIITLPSSPSIVYDLATGETSTPDEEPLSEETQELLREAIEDVRTNGRRAAATRWNIVAPSNETVVIEYVNVPPFETIQTPDAPDDDEHAFRDALLSWDEPTPTPTHDYATQARVSRARRP